MKSWHTMRRQLVCARGRRIFRKLWRPCGRIRFLLHIHYSFRIPHEVAFRSYISGNKHDQGELSWVTSKTQRAANHVDPAARPPSVFASRYEVGCWGHIWLWILSFNRVWSNWNLRSKHFNFFNTLIPIFPLAPEPVYAHISHHNCTPGYAQRKTSKLTNYMKIP